ncbi:Domain of unknown function DUF1801 [Fluviicola taffensis DSM 16823]|uniref:YdhG-like domain-containing protein n=2 Tax=Fluviicola TaxID=332102 RepID=F2IBU3_FLUTR|nr:Domain of unknown function DUF1801 [Fluviicola taffensis DSM 16823]
MVLCITSLVSNKMKTFTNVDQYIQEFEKETQERLIAIRKLIQETAPEAIESISYGMPAYKVNGKPLVYFGGYKSHIGFYATPTGHSAFEKELSKYKQGKGSVQFPLDEPLPVKLIKEIVLFRLAENQAKSGKK